MPPRARFRRPAGVAGWSAILILIGALLFGGTSEQGAASGFAIELVSLAILLGAALFGQRLKLREEIPGLTRIAAVIMLLYAAQLLPLAPTAWTALPGRGLIVAGFGLLKLTPGWQPLSMSPANSIASALALLPAACAVSLMLRMPRARLVAWGAALTAVSCLSVVIGIAQLVGGQASPLNFYYADSERARGFFANPNHLATLLLATLPIVAALATSVAQASTAPRARSLWMIFGAVTLLLALGVLITGSTAGAIMFLPTLAASLAVVLRGAPRRLARSVKALGVKALGVKALSVKALSVTAVVLAAALIPLGLMTLSGRTMRHHGIFGEDPLDRLGLAKTTVDGIKAYWPFGSGLGSFPSVYPTHERLDQVSDVFVNHAHNEYLEILFEAGIFGLAIIIIGLLWWARRTYQAWRSNDDDAPWRQASSIAIAVVIAHSSVDYPARTPAVLVVLGCCAALLDRRRSSDAREARGADSLTNDVAPARHATI